jgi:hypothetical protein
MHDAFRILFVALMNGALLPDVTSTSESSTVVVNGSGSVSVVTVQSASDGIMDHKLVLVFGNHADRMRRPR